MTKELKQEFTLRISQANKTQIIVLVYEIALSYIEDAKQDFADKRMEDYKKSVQKAQNCIAQLMESLNFEHEISFHLMQLYTYVNRELIHAVVKKEDSHLSAAKDVLTALHESFLEISKTDASRPMMENAQEVYAGLTYGRNDLTENLNDEGASRGFRI